MPAGGATIGSVSVRVLPNTANFVPSLQRYLSRIERTLRISVRVEADTTRAAEQVRATTERLSGQEVTANLTADTEPATREVEAWRARIARNAATIKVAVDRANLEQMAKATSGVVRSLSRIASRTILFGAIAASAGAASAAVGGLGAALAAMLPVVALVPGALAGIAAPAATLAVGFIGLGDAIKNAFDPSKADQFGEAMAKLAPNAQQFVRTMQGLAPPFRGLRLDVQQRLFAGLGGQLDRLATTYFPLLRTGMGGIADDLNQVARSFVALNTSTAAVADFSRIFANARTSVAPLGAALNAALVAVRMIAAESSNWLPGFANGIATAAGRFQAFIAAARQSGQLTAWIQRSIDLLRTLFSILGNLGSILVSVFSTASASGVNFLGVLDRATGAAAGFLRSAQGTQVLTQIFGGLRAAAAGLTPVFAAVGATLVSTLAPAIAQLGPQLGAAFASLAPAIAPLGQILAALAPVIGALARAFATTLTAALQHLAPIIVALSGPLTALLNRMAQSPGMVAAFAAGFLVLAKIVPMIGPIAQLVTSLGGLGSVVGILSRALAFLTGPIGIAIGLFTALMTTSAPFRAAVGQLVTVIGQLVAQLGSALAPILSTVVSAITPLVQLLGAVLAPVIRVVAVVLSGLVALLRGIVSGNLFTALGRMISGAFTGLLSSAGSFLSTLGSAIATGATAAWHGLVSALQTAVVAVGQFLANLPNNVAYALGYLAGLVVKGATAAWDFLWNTLPRAIGQAIAWLAGLPGRALAALAALGGLIANLARNAWQGFVNTTISVASSVWGFIQSIPGRVGRFLVSLPGVLARGASAAWRGFVDASIAAAAGIWDFLRSLPGRIGSFFADAGRWLLDAGSAILHGLWQGIQDALGWLWDKIKSIGRSIANGFKSALGISSPSKLMRDQIGRWIPEGIAAGIDAHAGTVADAMDRVGALVTGTSMDATATVDTAMRGGGPLFAGISTAVREGFEDVRIDMDGRAVGRGVNRAKKGQATR